MKLNFSILYEFSDELDHEVDDVVELKNSILSSIEDNTMGLISKCEYVENLVSNSYSYIRVMPKLENYMLSHAVCKLEFEFGLNDGCSNVYKELEGIVTDVANSLNDVVLQDLIENPLAVCPQVILSTSVELE